MHASQLTLRSLLALAILLAATAAARADRVVLHDGRILEGKVIDRGAELEVRLPHGAVRVARADVARIERAPTREEERDARLVGLDREDPAAIAALADWCRQNGFTDQGRDLARLAERVATRQREAELARRLAALPAGDADAMRALARWCRDAGFDSQALDLDARARAHELARRIAQAKAAGGADALVALADALAREGATKDEVARALGGAIAIDPDHAEARRRLGQRLFRGKWEDVKVVQATLAAEHAQAMRAKGLVLYEGSWVTPPDRQRLEEEDRKAEHRERLREEERRAAAADRARREQEALLAQRSAEREAAERDRARAETERARLEAAALEAQRAAAEAERCRIEEERERAAERERVARVALVAELRGRVEVTRAEIDSLKAERDALRWGPTPDDENRRRARDARIKGLDARISALERTLSGQRDALREAESLPR